MSKQIRPLVAFKKENPELYSRYYNLAKEGTTSKKGIENNFYLWYGALSLKPIKQKGIDSFLFTEAGDFTNKCTISEIGRLLLTGWYYDVEAYTKDVSNYVYNAYHKKIKTGENFNDLDYSEVVKHIRENISYYYNNQPELKYLILDRLFKETLHELLPPPDKIKSHNKAIDLLAEIRTNQKRKGIDFWIKKTEDWEGYSYYLQDKIESLDNVYLSFEDWIKENNNKNNEYLREIEALIKEYKEIVTNSNQIKLPL